MKEFNYTLDLAKVATNKELMAVTRLLADKIPVITEPLNGGVE